MLASRPIIHSRPQTLRITTAIRTVSHGISRCTTGSSITDTKMNAPRIGTSWRLYGERPHARPGARHAPRDPEEQAAPDAGLHPAPASAAPSSDRLPQPLDDMVEPAGEALEL